MEDLIRLVNAYSGRMHFWQGPGTGGCTEVTIVIEVGGDPICETFILDYTPSLMFDEIRAALLDRVRAGVREICAAK